MRYPAARRRPVVAVGGTAVHPDPRRRRRPGGEGGEHARPDGARSGTAVFFDLMHAGKESVAVDFTTDRGGRAARPRRRGRRRHRVVAAPRRSSTSASTPPRTRACGWASPATAAPHPVGTGSRSATTPLSPAASPRSRGGPADRRGSVPMPTPTRSRGCGRGGRAGRARRGRGVAGRRVHARRGRLAPHRVAGRASAHPGRDRPRRPPPVPVPAGAASALGADTGAVLSELGIASSSAAVGRATASPCRARKLALVASARAPAPRAPRAARPRRRGPSRARWPS